MIGLVQRISEARVDVSGVTVAAIGRGLLVLIGVQRGDGESQADRLLERILGYRVFPDADDRMNLSVKDIDGCLLLVPQFTLAADTQKGMRASFTPAAEPEKGEALFDYMVEQARNLHDPVGCGQFAAHMQVSLTNDGPVTFWLQVPPG